MNARRLALAMLAFGLTLAPLLALSACGDESDGHGRAPSAPSPATTRLPPTPTPSTTTPPTTASSTPTPTPPARESVVALTPAFPGLPPLEDPIALVEAPAHGLFLIATQDGVVYAIPRDGPYHTPRVVHDQRDRTRYGGEEGFLALTPDPEFARNGYLYAYYSLPLSDQGERASRLVRFETTGEGAAFAIDGDSELVILEIPQPRWNHNGGALVFGPDGMLYLGLGDGGGAGDPGRHGQNTQTLLGSILRLDVSEASPARPYAIPPDNPFADGAGGRPEIWAYGLRNPWRISFDPQTGLLWASDVGQDEREEVNIIERGGNYGWNVMEGSICFPREGACDPDGFVPPVWEYGRDDGCSIIGGHVYRGEAIPSLRGWYVYSDYCTGRLWAINAASAASSEQVEAVPVYDHWTGFAFSLAEDAGGELYLLASYGERPDSIFRVMPR